MLNMILLPTGIGKVPRTDGEGTVGTELAVTTKLPLDSDTSGLPK